MKLKILIFLLLFLSACSFEKHEAKVGEKSIDFSAFNLKNQKIKLSNDNKELKILVFFKQGCASCLKELPSLGAFIKKYPNKISVYAINSSDKKEVIKLLAEQYGFEHLELIKDELGLIAKNYSIFATPTTIIIKNNIIQDRILGEKPWSYIESKLFALL